MPSPTASALPLSISNIVFNLLTFSVVFSYLSSSSSSTTVVGGSVVVVGSVVGTPVPPAKKLVKSPNFFFTVLKALLKDPFNCSTVFFSNREPNACSIPSSNASPISSAPSLAICLASSKPSLRISKNEPLTHFSENSVINIHNVEKTLTTSNTAVLIPMNTVLKATPTPAITVLNVKDELYKSTN
jgi:hypothetical protein